MHVRIHSHIRGILQSPPGGPAEGKNVSSSTLTCSKLTSYLLLYMNDLIITPVEN